MSNLIEKKYGRGLAVVAGNGSGLTMTYAAYLVQIGYETILLVGTDEERLEQQKKQLLKQKQDGKELSVMWYAYDFHKANTDKEKEDLEKYVSRVVETCGNHCSILVNNLSIEHDSFAKLTPSEINDQTRYRIENHSFMTDLVTIKLRAKSLRKYYSLVVNVGTTKDNLVEKEADSFKNAKQQASWEIYKATTTYWSNLATLAQQMETVEVDFVKDTPENCGFFEENLKYLGLEVTAGSHVDQVFRSVVSPYKERTAQGIFKHKWMMFIMKPFFWALLPLKFVGLISD